MNDATKKALAELRKLAKNVRGHVYVMIKYASVCLADTDWIAERHGGDYVAARHSLQEEFFGPLGGVLSLGTLIDLYNRYPVAVWKKYKYDLACIRALAQQDKQGSADKMTGDRISWKTVALEAQERIAELEAELVQAQDRIAELEASESRLMRKVVEVEAVH